MITTQNPSRRRASPILPISVALALLSACAGQVDSEPRQGLATFTPTQAPLATAPATTTPSLTPSPEPMEVPAEEKTSAGSSAPEINPGNAADLAPLFTLTGHEDEVYQITFSPDGRLLASASVDGTIGIWDLADGSLLRKLKAHTAAVRTVDFSADGSLLASGGNDRTARLWQVEDGALVETIESAFMGYVLAVKFAPAGPLFAMADHLCETRLLRAPTGILDQSLRQPSCTTTEGTVVSWGLDFSPDGRYLVTGEGAWCCGGSLQRWTVDDRFEPPTLLEGYNLRTRELKYAPDGKTIAVALLGSPVFWLIDSATGDLIRTYDGHLYRVNSLAFSPDGQLLASASRDRNLALWLIDGSEPIATFSEHSDAINSVAFSPDGAQIATGGSDHTIHVWGIR